MRKTAICFFLFSILSFSKPAFKNSNFELGNFENWLIHEGWSLREPIYFPEEKLKEEESFGFFSAESSPWGRDIIEFYTGKNISPEKRILKSEKFLIDKPFLTFTMEGNLDRDKNCIGIDLNFDDICDIKFKENDIKNLINKGVKRFFLDLREFVGKEGVFIASVSSPPKFLKILIDDIELEDYVPCYFEIKEIKQNQENGEISLNIVNPYNEKGTIKLKITVYDYLSCPVLYKELNLFINPNSNVEEKISFRLNMSPFYRIHIVSLTEGNSVSQYISKRWYRSENKNERRYILINDGWEVTKSNKTDIELPEGNATWEKESPIKPSNTYGYRSPLWREKKAQVWYRKTIEIPEWFTEKHCSILLDGGGGGLLTVFVNGKEIGTENIFKYNRYRFEILNIKKGKNEIILRFRNPDYYLKEDNSPLEPYWFYYGPSIGIFGNIYLENIPDVYISKVLIDPSYRGKKLNCRIFIKNIGNENSPFTIESSVLDKKSKEVLKLNRNKGIIGPKEEKVLKIEQSWKTPILWTPETPELLSLKLILKTEKGMDVFIERFGFREFWVEGNKLLLNGYPISIFDLTMLETEKLYLAKKWYGANAKRAPWISYYDPLVHDEIGFLFRGLFEHIYPPKEYKSEELKERYWRKYIGYEIGTMEYLYNHPACWGWVIGNELGGQGYFRIPDLKERFIKLAKILSSIDPTRPVSSDGDLDLFGNTPIWNVHYPREYGIAYGLPNNAYFFQKGIELMDWFPHPTYDGEKPVFLGEAFSGGNITPAWLSPIKGEEVYKPIELFEAWKELYIIRQRAYREQEVAGYEPFEPFFYVKNFYPIDIYVKNYDHLFYSGETIKREVVIFNGIFNEKKINLKWELGDHLKGLKEITLNPGDKKVVALEIKLPETDKRINIPFKLHLEENGVPVSKRWGSWESIYSIFPKIKLNYKVSVIPYNKEISKMLEFFGLETTSDIQISKIVFTDGEFLKEKRAKSFLNEGGTIVVLNQQKDIEGYPLLTEHSDTRCHIISPFHPVLKDIKKEDFYFWGEDNWVCKKAYLKSAERYGKVILEAGDQNGLRMTPLIEIPEGDGSIIFCSLLLTEKYKSNPVIRYLIRNLIEYSQKLKIKEPLNAGMLVSDIVYSTLKNKNFVFDDLAQIENIKLEDYKVLIIDTEISNCDIEKLSEFVKEGGILVLQRITPENIKFYQSLLPLDFKLIPAYKENHIYSGEIIKIKQHPLFEGISNYDFFWKKGTFERGGPKVRITSEVADYYISSNKIDILTSPPVFGIYKNNKGVVIIDQIRWEEAFRVEEKAIRSFINLCVNLGVSLRKEIEERIEEYKEVLIPYNIKIEKIQVDEINKEKVKHLLKGEKTFKNIPFNFSSEEEILILGTEKNFNTFSKSVKIPVNLKAEKIYFLHTSAYGYIDYDIGKKIIEYRLTLENGTKINIPVRYGNEIFEYISDDPGTLIDTEIATSFKKDGISLYLFKWINPYPVYRIQEIEVVACEKTIVPIIAGITFKIPEDKTIKRKRREGLWSIIKSRQDEAEKGRIWAIIGPFPNNPPPRGGYDFVYLPEKEIDFNKTYDGYGKKVKWEKYVQPENLFNKVVGIDRLELFEIKSGLDKENYVCYFYTKVYSEKERDVILAFGVDDAGKIWVNRKLVYEKFVHKYPAIPADIIIPVKLQKGWNEILLKIVNNFLEAGFYFDMKDIDEKSIEEWKKGNKSAIERLPSLKLPFNAFVEEKDKIDIPNLLLVETGGKKYFCDLVGTPPDSFDYSPPEKTLRINFKNKGMESLQGIIPFEIKRGDFKKGIFELKFLVPKGASSSHISLVGRNAGGINIGDITIELLGGYPAEQYGGEKNKKPQPYQTMRIRYDREEQKVVDISLKDVFEEGVWQELLLKWGDVEGLKVILNGKVIFSDEEDKLPIFDSHSGVNLSLPSDFREKNLGEIYIKDIFLKGNYK